MGDLSDAVQWWDESQLRVLVLVSLGVQYFLTIFGGGRKGTVPSWFRFTIWLSYLGSDALAIYALATLFNRQKKPSSSHGSSRDLEILWAPFLLMHLGGQIFITAYNIEDNELWRRYIVTALSQVAVALYVFFKLWSFSVDSSLLFTVIVVFIPGILKCFAKPWALKYASFHSLADSLDLGERTTTTSREEELKEYVRKAKNCVSANDNVPEAKLHGPEMLFVDFAYTNSQRLTNLRCFCELLHNGRAFRSLRAGLSDVFDRLYTRKNCLKSLDNDKKFRELDWGSRVARVALIASGLLPGFAAAHFHASNKKAYRRDDVVVTFVLMYSSMVLEVFSVMVLIFYKSYWPDMVAQRSILGQFAHNKRHKKRMIWATRLGCKTLLDQHKSCRSSRWLTELACMHVQDGWENYIKDAESYREFNDMRGQWTLQREERHGRLNWSLEKPFDESVLLWHIATDLCFHHMGKSAIPHYSRRCREMSNYMMHLLTVNPEMLMPGSRRRLFATAYKELEAILEGVEEELTEERKIAKKVMVKKTEDTSTKEKFICDACVLAEGLMGLGGEKMWKVIGGVWVEMMCFSAGRCRGYLHAKALGSGGEYLSYVWLMLAYYGMETFPERLQRTNKLYSSAENMMHLHSGGEDVAGPSAPQGMKEETTAVSSASRGTEEEITAAPSTSQGDCTVEISP